MKPQSFLKAFGILSFYATIVVLATIPILLHQVRDVVFNLNLEKNRQQAERLATLASIDLEGGARPEEVLAKIQQMLENTPQSDEHFACIIEDEDKVIAHPKRSNVNKDVAGWTIENEVEVKTFTQSAGEGVSFGGIQTRLDGSQDISYQVPISTKPWSVCVHTKLDVIYQQTSMILRQIGWVALPGILVLLLLFSFAVTKREEPESG